MARAFDVVVVPDFRFDRVPVFEPMTLFFLASWIEHSGRARDFPLHLACIGEPPPSVRWLAERCHASITIHQPVGAERRGSSNKLRGLEVDGQEDRVLLLDVDVLVLSDISDLAEVGSCIAVSSATKPRVPERYWRKIYPALGMEPPTERIASVAGELGCPAKMRSYPEQIRELNAMFPYYNTGVVLVPWEWAVRLRPLWEEHIRKIAALFDQRDEAWEAVAYSDQAGFATSIEVLKRQGLRFVRLPHAFHANRLHLYRGALRLRDIKLFHGANFFPRMRSSRKMARAPDALRRARYRYYCGSGVLRMCLEWWKQDGRRFRVGSVGRYLLPSMMEAYALSNVLQRLYARHVAPALRETGRSVED